MTSDDTKVDTSEKPWRINSGDYTPSEPASGWEAIVDTEDGFVAEFCFLADAEHALLAIQSLPNVTAERDRWEATAQKLFQEHVDLIKTKDALSARVKELEETNDKLRTALTTASRRIDKILYDTLPRTDMNEAQWRILENTAVALRALIGKEPSK